MKNTTYEERDEFAILTAQKNNGESFKCAIPIIAMSRMNKMLTTAGMPKFEDWSDENDLAMLFRVTHLCYVLHTMDILIGAGAGINKKLVEDIIAAMNKLHKELVQKGIAVSRDPKVSTPHQQFTLFLQRILHTSYPGFLPGILINIPQEREITPDELIHSLMQDFQASYKRDLGIVR